MAAEFPEEQPRTSFWSDYGPPIIGAFIILAVLVGGWYIWRQRTQAPQSEEVAQVEQVEQVEQEAEPSPSPAPEEEEAAEAPETETANGMAELAKGGPQELPATGFPVPLLATASLLALAAGWKLRKSAGKLLD